jgi:hypothetical protein
MGLKQKQKKRSGQATAQVAKKRSKLTDDFPTTHKNTNGTDTNELRVIVDKNLKSENQTSKSEVCNLSDDVIEDFVRSFNVKEHVLNLMKIRDQCYLPFTDQWNHYTYAIEDLKKGLTEDIYDSDVPWHKDVILNWYHERDDICKPFSTPWRLYDRCLWHQHDIFPESNTINSPVKKVRPYGKAHEKWLMTNKHHYDNYAK